MPAAQPAQMVIAQPFNDVQLAAMIAGNLVGAGDEPRSAVEKAYSIIGAAIALYNAGRLGQYTDLHRKALSGAEGGKDA